MTQDYQMLGQASTELDQVAADKNGWGGVDVPEPPISQETDPHTSFWAGRANYQALGHQIDSMAGYSETPSAAVHVEPFDPYHPGPQE